jgi:hypothetical protein
LGFITGTVERTGVGEFVGSVRVDDEAEALVDGAGSGDVSTGIAGLAAADGSATESRGWVATVVEVVGLGSVCRGSSLVAIMTPTAKSAPSASAMGPITMAADLRSGGRDADVVSGADDESATEEVTVEGGSSGN